MVALTMLSNIRKAKHGVFAWSRELEISAFPLLTVSVVFHPQKGGRGRPEQRWSTGGVPGNCVFLCSCDPMLSTDLLLLTFNACPSPTVGVLLGERLVRVVIVRLSALRCACGLAVRGGCISFVVEWWLVVGGVDIGMG